MDTTGDELFKKIAFRKSLELSKTEISTKDSLKDRYLKQSFNNIFTIKTIKEKILCEISKNNRLKKNKSDYHLEKPIKVIPFGGATMDEFSGSNTNGDFDDFEGEFDLESDDYVFDYDQLESLLQEIKALHLEK